MCGLIGMVSNEEAKWSIYEALNILQHRGQDAAGIAMCEDRQFRMHRDVGLVRDVFTDQVMDSLCGTSGIAHVRYPTAGSRHDLLLAQPFYVNYPYGIFLAHNGNLTNREELKEDLLSRYQCHINTDSDSEVLLNVFAQALHRNHNGDQDAHPNVDAVFAAVSEVHRQCRGAYSVVALLCGHGLLAFRDPNGIRPLVLGEQEVKGSKRYMVSSESVALDVLGFKLRRDIAPGEAVYIECDSQQLHKRQCADSFSLNPCIFEHVYLARPDSIMDGVPLYQARLGQGAYLAKKIMREGLKDDIDVIVPVPDTGRVAAQMISQMLKINLREGLMKNRYIGRTFIMPDQAARDHGVRRKLNPISAEFDRKNVLLVDDSIVRGTTSKQLIDLARGAGAKKVYFASAAPPVRYPNLYGIDIPLNEELIAYDRSDDEVRKEIGADWLVYQDLEDLVAASKDANPDIARFECSVFDGYYVTEDGLNKGKRGSAKVAKISDKAASAGS